MSRLKRKDAYSAERSFRDVFSLSPFELRNRHLSARNPTVLSQTIRVKNRRTPIYKWNESIHFSNFDNGKQIKVSANEIKKHFGQGIVLLLYPFKMIHFAFAIFIITRLHHLHLRSPLIVWMAHNFLLIEFHFPHLRVYKEEKVLIISLLAYNSSSTISFHLIIKRKLLFDLLLHSLVSAVVFPCSRCSKYNMAHLKENDCLHLCFFFILYVYRYVYNLHNCTYTFSSLLWRLFRLDFLWQSDNVSTLKEKRDTPLGRQRKRKRKDVLHVGHGFYTPH